MAVCFKTREESQWSLTFEVRKSGWFRRWRWSSSRSQWSLTFEVRKSGWFRRWRWSSSRSQRSLTFEVRKRVAPSVGVPIAQSWQWSLTFEVRKSTRHTSPWEVLRTVAMEPDL